MEKDKPPASPSPSNVVMLGGKLLPADPCWPDEYWRIVIGQMLAEDLPPPGADEACSFDYAVFDAPDRPSPPSAEIVQLADFRKTPLNAPKP